MILQLLRRTRAVLRLEITKNRSLLYPGTCKLPGLETARHLTRRKLIVVSVRSCDSHCTLGTQLTLPPILSTTIQQSILLSRRSLAGKPVPVPVSVVVAHLCKQHFRPISLIFSPHQRLVAVTRSW